MDRDVARESDAAERNRLVQAMESLQDLVDADHRAIDSGSIASSPEIDALLLDGLNSGPPFPVDRAWWERKRADLKEQLKQSRDD